MHGDGWDVIVVGAGLGGLTAALRLVREGLRVVVVDAASHPGGTAYVFRRGDFLFPMGALGCANPELVRATITRAGMKRPPVFHRVHYRLRAFGLDLPISRPFRDTADALARHFPEEAAAIKRFFLDMEYIAKSLLSPTPYHHPYQSASGTPRGGHWAYAPPTQVPPDGERLGYSLEPPGRPEYGGRIPPLPGTSAAFYLKGMVKDPRLRRILGSMGTREPFANLAILAAMWSLLCQSGIHYPQGGFYGLSDALAAELAPGAGTTRPRGGDRAGRSGYPPGECGGSGIREPRPRSVTAPGSVTGRLPPILLGRRVSRIKAERGRVRGVTLQDGTSLTAEAVVSNADFKNTFLRLVDPEALPEPFLRRLRSAPLTSSNLQVCLGLEAAKADLSSFLEGTRIIYRREDAPDVDGEQERAPEWDPARAAQDELELCLLSADDPSLAPPGKAVLVIRTAVPYEAFQRLRGPGGGRDPGYMEYKKKIGRALVREAAVLIPGLEDSVEVMDVATPLTFEERGGRFRGAVAGWSWDYGENLDRPVELVRTPVSGLFMAGHQAFSMLALGGIPSAVLSGLRAAEYVLQGEGPVEDMELPGS